MYMCTVVERVECKAFMEVGGFARSTQSTQYFGLIPARRFDSRRGRRGGAGSNELG